MDFIDFETIYALDLDDVLTGEREPTEEERALLAMIGAGAPDFGGEKSSGWLEALAILLSMLG